MKRENPLVSGGTLALVLGAMAFFPSLLDREFLITAWLGSMQQPVGLSAMVVGGVLLAIGKLRDFRNSSPVVNPPDVQPNVLSDPVVEPSDTPKGV